MIYCKKTEKLHVALDTHHTSMLFSKNFTLLTQNMLFSKKFTLLTKKNDIFENINKRLKNNSDKEFQTAIKEIHKIAKIRLDKIT